MLFTICISFEGEYLGAAPTKYGLNPHLLKEKAEFVKPITRG